MMLNFRPLYSRLTPNQRPPLLFRSGELLEVNNEEIAIIRRDLLIKSYIDLRTMDEIEKQGKPRSLINAGIKWYHHPIADDNHYFRTKLCPDFFDYYDSYRCLLENNKHQFKNIFLRLISSYKERCLFACFAGKDRTGIVAILLLLLLEFKNAVIVNEYVQSGKYLLKEIDYFKQKWLSKNLSKEQYLYRIKPDPKTALLLINYIGQKYGSIHGYMSEIELDKKDYQEFVKTLQLDINLN